jgi:hypothetical protein
VRDGFVNTSDQHDIAEFLQAGGNKTLPAITGSEAFAVSSTSVQDAAAGTGARSVLVVYLNSGWAIAQELVTLNGTTAVALAATGIKEILGMEVDGNVGSAGTAVGNISLHLVGNTSAVYERITGGGNRSLTAKFVVPLGYEAIIPSWTVSAINNDQEVRLRATVNTLDRTLSAVYKFQAMTYVPTNSVQTSDIQWLKFPAKCIIKCSTIPAGTAGTVRASVSIPLFIVAGD